MKLAKDGRLEPAPTLADRLFCDMTRITRIRIIPLRVPYVAPISISVGTISEARNVIVRLYTNSNLEGVGEASPFILNIPGKLKRA